MSNLTGSQTEYYCYDVDEKRNLLLNLSCYSSAIKSLKIERKNGELFTLRPTIHVYICSKFGLQKSTIFERIEEAFDMVGHPVKTLSDLTAASVKGTIDQKTRELIYPTAWYCKGGSLLVDEFNLLPNQASDIVKSFLTLLENEKVERRISLKEKESFKTDDVYCFDGWLKFRHLRCNVIFATMKNIKKNREMFFSGLVSRCVPIFLNSTVDKLIEFDDDPNRLFHKVEYGFPKEITVPFKEYDVIRGTVLQYEVQPQMFFRTLNDCVRCYAVLKEHDFDLYDYIITSRNWNLAKTSQKNEEKTEITNN